MKKKQVQQRVLKNGEPLSLDKFEWDEKTNTLSSDENCLVLDFSGIENCTFNTGPGCTFKTGHYCTFDTGHYCTFKTGHYCTFNTGSGCTFDTGSECVVVRRDIYEVIELEEGKKIKLNNFNIRGYVYVDEEPTKMITLSNGKKVSEETVIEALKGLVE